MGIVHTCVSVYSCNSFSLLVSIDIIRMLQSSTPCGSNPCYSFNDDDLNENLGQIDYLVTEKAFSLTKNLKSLKFFIINNEIYIDSEKPIPRESERIYLTEANEHQYMEDFKEKVSNANQIQ